MEREHASLALPEARWHFTICVGRQGRFLKGTPCGEHASVYPVPHRGTVKRLQKMPEQKHAAERPETLPTVFLRGRHLSMWPWRLLCLRQKSATEAFTDQRDSRGS